MTTAYYNECNPFAAAWLRELITAGLIAPGDVDDRSIADVRSADLAGYAQCHFFAGLGGWSHALRLAGWDDDRRVWTGSCPCQPWSVAGSGEGTNDPRHLWPTWFRLIEELRPSVIFGEQTASTDGRYWLDLVYVGLEARDYAVAAANLPAASIGAPHARARLWFVANTNSEGLDRPGLLLQQRGPYQDRVDVAGSGQARALGHTNGVRTERIAGREGRAERPSPSRGQDERRWGLQALNASAVVDVGDSHGSGLAIRSVDKDGQRAIRIKGSAIGQADATRGVWADCEWLWHRDGVYRAVGPGTFPLAARLPGDVDKIRAFGNAIVPQVAAAFVGAYMDTQAHA